MLETTVANDSLIKGNDNPTTAVTLKVNCRKNEERRERREGEKKEEKFYLLVVCGLVGLE